MEINGSTHRSNLTDNSEGRPKVGARLALGSNAHSTAQMNQIPRRLSGAARGWIEARSVVNTWPFVRLHRWLDRQAYRPQALSPLNADASLRSNGRAISQKSKKATASPVSM